MILRIIAALAVTLAVLSFAASGAQPTGTFTFQGALRDTNVAANGSYDFVFSLFDDPLSGDQVGTSVDLSAISVTRGLFTVPIDFGLAAFDGQPRWLEIQVRLVGAAQYTTLTPRMEVTSAPVASYAHQARLVMPYADIVSLPGPLFSLTQQGAGMVATFIAANPASVSPAVDVQSAGLAEAARFVTTNPANASPAALASSAGVGPALRAIGGTAGDFLGDVNVAGRLTPTSFRLQPGAAAGRVLTSDGAGVASWQIPVSYSAGAGLQLIGTVFSVADSGIVTSMIANSAITNAKIADDAISTNKLANSSVTTDKIADQAITASDLADNSVTSAKLASNLASLVKVSGGTLANSGGSLSASVAFASAGTISSAQSSEMLINAMAARAVDAGVTVTIRSDATIGTTTGMYCGVRISAAAAGTYRVVVPIDVPVMLYGRKPTSWSVTTHYSDASAANFITRTRVFNTHMNELASMTTDNADRTSADHTSYSVTGPSFFNEEWRGKAVEYQVTLAAGGWLSIGTVVVTYTY